MRKRWWVVLALVVVGVPFCCCGGGWTMVLPMFFSKDAVAKAHAKCVELGHRPHRLVFANYNWSGSMVGQSEVSVSFIVADSKPTKFVHVSLRRPSFLSDWTVVGSEEQVLPEEKPEKGAADKRPEKEP